MAMSPPIAGDTGAGALLGTSMAAGPGVPGAGADAQSAQIQSLTQGLRQVELQMDTLAGQFPPLAPVVQQAKQILKQGIVQALSAMQSQTMSGANLPGAGMAQG